MQLSERSNKLHALNVVVFALTVLVRQLVSRPRQWSYLYINHVTVLLPLTS